MEPDVEMVDDPDPIVASYDVYIMPQLKDDQSIYILQFPNRDASQEYSAENSSMPIEVRLKEKSGLVELDVPIDVHRSYDRIKGLKWGQAMNKSNLSKGNAGASHGLPGGFGIGGAQVPRTRANARNDVDEEELQAELLRDFGNAVREEKVLTKQTLGGQTIPKKKASPQYMIGAFRANQLHLTPVGHIVQMSPQFHHIDAAAEIEKFAAKKSDPGTRTAEPRAIHMTVKATGDGEEETTDTMAERVRSVQEEPWRKLEYVDQSTDAAWEEYANTFFVGNADLAPKLESTLTNAEYLDAISAPRDIARLSRSKKVLKGRSKNKDKGKGKEAHQGGGQESESSDTLSDSGSDSEA